MKQKDYVLFERFPFSLNFVAGPILAYLTILLNITVFIALFSKKILTPATVLMQGLALADSLTAFCMYGFEPLFYHAYKWTATGNDDIKIGSTNFGNISSNTADLVTLSYPYCAIHYYVGHLTETFHLASVFLTACLGLQKVVAILVPVWSRTGMTARKSVVVCLVCFIFSTCLHLPRMLIVTVKASNGTCGLSENRKWLQLYVLTVYPMVASVVLGLAGLSMIAATFIIIGQFCVGRRKLGKSSLTAYEKRSSILVKVVLMIFLITETPRFYLNKTVFSSYRSSSMQEDVVWNRIMAVTKEDLNAAYQSVNMERLYELTKIKAQYLYFRSRALTCADNNTSYLKDHHPIHKLFMLFVDGCQHNLSVGTTFDCFKLAGTYLSLDEKYDSILLKLKDLCHISYIRDYRPDTRYFDTPSWGSNIAEILHCNIKETTNAIFRTKQKKFYDRIEKKTNPKIFTFLKNKIDSFWKPHVTKVIDVMTVAAKDVEKNWDSVVGRGVLDEVEKVVKNFSDCWTRFSQNLENNVLQFVLAMTPYSEQINYLMTTEMEELSTNLKDLKLLMEVLKLCTIAGCLSNFIIYIVLSEKLRNEMRRKVCLCVKKETNK